LSLLYLLASLVAVTQRPAAWPLAGHWQKGSTQLEGSHPSRPGQTACYSAEIQGHGSHKPEAACHWARLRSSWPTSVARRFIIESAQRRAPCENLKRGTSHTAGLLLDFLSSASCLPNVRVGLRPETATSQVAGHGCKELEAGIIVATYALLPAAVGSVSSRYD
jgi:hypothetical protein